MLFRQGMAVIVLPFSVLVVIPGLLVRQAGGPHWWWETRGVLIWFLGAVGALCIVTGLRLIVATVRHFAVVGKGTLAPWDPPRELVVVGIYRHVRNPMISGVIWVLAGESLMFGLIPVAVWWVVFLATNLIYIPLVEEPSLSRRFGSEYEAYCHHVPRWLPSIRPWQGPDS